MNLRELLDGVACEVVQGRPDVEVKMIHFDSRKVGEGDLFVAQRGVSADGHGYIGKAVRQEPWRLSVRRCRESCKRGWCT